MNLINPRYASMVYLAAGATVSAAAAMFTRIEAVKIVGLTVLTGVGYGIINDMFACRDCIEYFTVGHRYVPKELELKARPLMTLNLNLNALVWGMIATWHDTAIAGVILAAVARVPLPFFHSKITARQLAPYLAIGAALLIIGAHVASRNAQAKMIEKPQSKYFGVPMEFQAGWEACNTRNSVGYAGLAVGSIALIIGMIASRSGFFK